MGLGRLMVFFDEPFWKNNGVISTNRAFILFMQALLPSFDRLLYLGRIHPEPSIQPYRCLPHPGSEFRELPYYSSLYALLGVAGSLPRGLRAAWKAIGECDVIMLGIPHPWALPLWAMSVARRRLVIFLVRQDLLGRVRLRSSRFKRLLAIFAVTFMEGLFILLSRKTLTFTVGGAMFERYFRPGSPVHSILVSLVPAGSLRTSGPRTLPSISDTRRVLWVGRIDSDKGLEVLLDAFHTLLAKRLGSLRLDLVGNGAIENELKLRVRQMGLENEVRFHGYVPFGASLNALYDAATLFVLPSNESEGFPQVILEALSRGLPIISTAVAGIPFVLKDEVNALLIPPRNSQVLARTVERILTDASLYTKLSARGLEVAREHTLEAERDRMLQHIGSFLSTQQQKT